MATIVQNYGPIYGEVVNGTVQGRPNGSVFVPISNTITLAIPAAYRYILSREINGVKQYLLTASDGVINWSRRYTSVAQSQDLSNNITIEVSADSDFSTILGTYSFSAGQFNVNSTYLATDDPAAIVAENTYYVRAALMANGSHVAISDAIELTGVDQA